MAGSAHAQQLADRFNQLNNTVIAFVESLSDQQWGMPCGDDRRPIGLVAHHIATAYGASTGWVATMASGQPLPPLTIADIDAWNAQHAEANAAVGKADTLALLRRNGGEAVAVVGNMSDEELARSGTVALLDGARVTTAQLIEGLLLGHPRGHLQAMRAALS